MGGGAGISVHGSHRIVTERVLFAMPETGIGFFPDVGGTYFLPRCPGEIGTYLGLTGQRIGAADCLYAGIATQFVPVERLEALEGALSTLPAGAAAAQVDAVLAPFAAQAGAASLDDIRETLDEILAGDSLLAAMQAAERDPTGTGTTLLEQLRERSPLSLAVTFAQLRKGGACLSFEEAMQLEFRLASRFLRSEDFYEGVRAAVIDKDRRPRWSYPDVAAVPQEVVDNYFASLDGAELELDWQGL
jgi:enoyl-CoA hydratase